MFRIGYGYDIHPTQKGDHIIMGGIRIPCTFSLKGHSDADVLLHSITDAILGSLGSRDIGFHFPSNDIKNKKRNSSEFLKYAIELMHNRNYGICNLDVNIICEQPKIQDHRDKLEANIAKLLQTNIDLVNIKAKTNEKLDSIGKGKAIAVHSIVLLQNSVE